MIAFLALLTREVKRFMKVIVQTVLSPLISTFLYLLIFGVGLGSQLGNVQESVPFLAFLIPGLMMMTLINNSFQNSSSSVVASKFSGDLEDIRAAPITNFQIVAALSVGALIRGIIVSLVTLLVGEVFYFVTRQEWLGVAHPIDFLFFTISGGLLFGLLGISVAFVAKSFDQLTAFTSFVLLPLTYLGGVFISLDHLSEFWRSVAVWNPLLYLINGLRFGVLGLTEVSLAASYGMVLISLVAAFALATFSVTKGSFQRW